MPKEIETKFKINNPAEVKKALKNLGARFVSRELEKDVYYKSPFPFFGAIRLRRIGGKGLFTIKTEDAKSASSRYKVRDEFEIEVDDARIFANMLRRLKFKPIFRKEKMRESYRWHDVNISIDELPCLGFYVEIEAAKKTIQKTARLLGLEINNAIPDTYMQLFNYYKLVFKKPGLELVFKK